MKNFKLDGRHVRQALSLVMALFLIGSVSYLGERFYAASHAATGASMSVNPASQAVTSGSTLSVTIRENSGTDTVNAVQSSITYDAAQLQYVSMSNGSFPFDAADKTDQAGLVRVARAIQTGTLSGDQAIVTINFKVLASSGTVSIGLDKAFSSVQRSTDNADILATVSAGSYAASAAPTSPATISLLPASGAYAPGSLIDVAVHINSPVKKITVVEPVIQYPANQLSFVKVTNSATFPTAMSDKNNTGILDITRGISGGGAGVTGDNIVATVQFKVTGSSGSMGLTLTNTSAAYDNSGTGANVLDLTNSRGAAYSITSTASAPTPAPTQPSAPATTTSSPSGGSTGSASTVYTRSGGISVSSASNAGNASQGSSGMQLQGSVDLAPVMDASQMNMSGDSITKVEYYLDKKLIATSKTAPFSYKFDTKTLKNGTYQMMMKTYYKSGMIDTSSDNLVVKNPVTLGYIMAHYAVSIFGTLLALAVIAFAVLKYILPHLHGKGGAGFSDKGYDGYVGYAPAPTASGQGFVAPEPTVITPNTPGSEQSPVLNQTPSPQVITPSSVTAPQQSAQSYQLPPTQTPPHSA